MRKHQSLLLIIGIGTLLMQPGSTAYLHPPQVLAQSAALSQAQLRQLAQSITVKIISGNRKGSGTLIRKQGQVYTVLTNEHVIKSGTQTHIKTSDGRTHAAEVVTEAMLAGKDLALVQFRSADDYRVARFANLSTVAVNAPVYGAGYPFDAEPSQGFILSTGKVLMVPERSLQEGYQIGYSNNIKKGMSGGPILNSEGKVIGVNGIHAYPFWGDPYRYEDGTRPTEAMRATMKHLSWGIPIQKAQLVPPAPPPSTVSPIADVMNEIAGQITVLIKWGSGNGSGFIIAKQGKTYTVLTNEHVVRGKNEFEIVTPDGERYRVRKNEKTVRTLEDVDLAVMQFDSDKDYRVARLGNYDLRGRITNLSQDWYVFVSGWPGSDKGEFSRLFTAGRLFNKTSGLLLAKDSYSLTYGYELVYTNITKLGVSGGPILDLSGRVIGIHGRAEGKNHKDTDRNIHIGYSLGVPVRKFVNLATKVGIEPDWLKIETDSPPSLTRQEKDSFEEALVAAEKPRDKNDAIDWLNYGNQLWRIGRGEEAIAAFDRAIKLMPSLYEAWYVRGIALDNQGRYQEAIKSFDESLDEKKGGNKNFGPAWRWRGLVLSSMKQYEDALASLEKATALDRKDSAAHFWRIVALKKLNRYKDLLKVCNEDIESSFDSRIKILFYNDCGIGRLKFGDYPGAISDFNKAIEINDKFAPAYSNRGVARLNLKDYQGAIADANKALEIDPNFTQAYINRSDIRLTLMTDKEGALADANKAIEIDPNFAPAYNYRSKIHQKLGDYEGALADANKALEIDPNFAQAYINRSGINLKLRDNQGALADANKAIELNPNFAEAYSNRGWARRNLGDNKNALADANKAIKLNPNLPKAYFLRGNVSIQLEDYQGALEALNKAIALNPEFAEAYLIRGLLNYQQRDYPAALSDYNQILSLNQNILPVFFPIGLVKYEMGKREEAIKHWQKAVAIDKKDARLKMALAVALYDRGDRDIGRDGDYDQGDGDIRRDRDYDRGDQDIDRGLATAEEALKLDKRLGDLKYLKEELLWGKKLRADARKLLAHPRIQALLDQAE